MRIDQLDKPAIVQNEVQAKSTHPKVDNGEVSLSSGVNADGGGSQGSSDEPNSGGKLSKILELIQESQKKKDKLSDLKKVEGRNKAIGLYNLVKGNFTSLDVGRVLLKKV